MLASTEKAGTGVNMQERLYALHHLDAPWRPSDVEQREGRIMRPYNRYPEVRIFNYVTEGSFDGFIWQTLENKARFISQIMSGEVAARSTEDVDDMVITAAQVKAIASGNPRILERVSIEVELTRLSRLYIVWRNSRRNLKWELESLPGRVREADLRVAGHEQAKAFRDQNPLSEGAFSIPLRSTIGSEQWLTFDQRTQASEHLDKLRREVSILINAEHCRIGSYRGFEILAQKQRNRAEAFLTPVEGFLSAPSSHFYYPFNFSESAQGTIQSIDAQLKAIDTHLQRALKTQAELKHKQQLIEQELSSGWDYAKKYEDLQAQLKCVNQKLKDDGSQIDERLEFPALDTDAFQRLDHNVNEIPSERSDLSSVSNSIQTGADDKEALSSTINENSEEVIPAGRPLTADDSRHKPRHKLKERSASASVENQSKQMSLW